MSGSIRADKWLWATRFFKTRGLAAEMCAAGKVIRNGHPLKPSSPVHPGDLLDIPFPEGPGLRRISVTAIIVTRLGAPQARACYEDLTDPAVLEALEQWFAARRDAAGGRPTKRDRRKLDQIHGFLDGL